MTLLSLFLLSEAPVFLRFSEPAKSTKWNLEVTSSLQFSSLQIRLCFKVNVNIAWDLEDESFI